MCLVILVISSYSTSPAKFREFDAGNMIFQNIFFGRNIKETTLVRHFIKVTGHLDTIKSH